MKTIIPFIALLFSFTANAQVISRFTWQTAPLTTAVTGPNGISVSSSAVPQYVNSTIGYAINPGLPTKNVDLVIPGSPYFDVNSIDIQFDFRREESVASFFKRGSLFNFQMNNGALSVTFTTTQGSTPGNLTINSGNILNIVEDHNFHHYRFQYDNNTGIARVWVDGSVVYTYNGVAGRPLAWTNAGNVIVGENMDATSRNVPIFANLVVQNVSNAMLPVKLTSFTAAAQSNKASLQWTTAEEVNFSHFEVERSSDVKVFENLGTVKPSASNKYKFIDQAPANGTNYYRLKMVDKDGAIKYSEVIRLNFEAITGNASCFPNPATNFVNVHVNKAEGGVYDYSVTNIQGNIVKASSANLNSGAQQLKIALDNVAPGILIIRLHNRQTKTTEIFRIVKA